MEVNEHNHHETTKQDRTTASADEQLIDMESEDTEKKNDSQKEEAKAAHQNRDNYTKDAKIPVGQTENYSTLDTGASKIEGGSVQHNDENSIHSNSRLGHLDLILGVVLGSVLGPLSFLVVICWRGMGEGDTRRSRILQGCSVGIIFQIVGLAIAFSVYKLTSRRT